MKEFVKLDRIGGINGSGIYFYTMRRAERNYFYVNRAVGYEDFLYPIGGKGEFSWDRSKRSQIYERPTIRGRYKEKYFTFYDLFLIEWSDKKMFLKVANKCILDYFMGAEKTQYDARSSLFLSQGYSRLYRSQELFVSKPRVPFIEITSGEVTEIGFENYPSCDGRSESTKELEEIEMIKIKEVPYGPD